MQISEKILADFQQGRLESFYMEIYPSLYRYAARVLGASRGYLAEDCVQEAVYRLYKHSHEFDTPLKMKSFLFTCVRNEVVNIFRKNERHNSFVSHERYIQDKLSDTLMDEFVLQETLDRLYAAIDRLPKELRELFDMSFEQGMKNKDIAQLLRLSPETIKKRKARLISLLRQHFSGDEHVLFLLFVFCSR